MADPLRVHIAFKAVLEAYELKYEEVEDCNPISVVIRDSSALFEPQLFMALLSCGRRGVAEIDVASGYKVPEKNRSAAAMYFAKLNCRLSSGFYMLNMDSGEVRFHGYAITYDAMPNEALTQAVRMIIAKGTTQFVEGVNGVITLCEKYKPQGVFRTVPAVRVPDVCAAASAVTIK